MADILIADGLRQIDRSDALADHPACSAYIACATACSAFARPMPDQMKRYAAADRAEARMRTGFSQRKPIMTRTG